MKSNSTLALGVTIFVVLSAFSACASEDSGVVNILSMEADSAYGEYLAGECAACHSPAAKSDSPVPQIYGVEKKHIIEQLLAYQNGTRENTTMQSVANGLSNEEIAALAEYLSGVSAENQ